MGQDKKRGYDAIVEANRRANAELTAMLTRDSGAGFFDKKEASAEEISNTASKSDSKS